MSGGVVSVIHGVHQTNSLDAVELADGVRRVDGKEPGGEIEGIRKLEIAGRNGFVIDLEKIDRSRRYVYVYVKITE